MQFPIYLKNLREDLQYACKKMYMQLPLGRNVGHTSLKFLSLMLYLVHNT